MLKKTILAVALAAGSMSVMAAEMPKGELELGYSVMGADEGYKVGASVEAYKGIAVDVDYVDLGSDTSVLEYGFSYAHMVNEDVALVGGVKAFDSEWAGLENDGYSVSLAAQTQVASAVSLVTGVERLDLDSGEHTDFFVGLDVAVADDVSVKFGHRQVLDETSLSVAWRF